MGLRTSGKVPRLCEDLREYSKSPWQDVSSLPNFDFTPCGGGGGGVGAASSSASTGFGNHENGEVSGSGASQSSGASYDGLDSSLMDNNVRAMLKTVTVNEVALNQTIQKLGGGEKGLKELMNGIMTWVRAHRHGNSDHVSFAQHLENLRNTPLPLTLPHAFEYALTDPCLGDAPHRLRRFDAQCCGAAPELSFLERCSKSRRLAPDPLCNPYRTRASLGEDHSGAYRGHSAFPDVTVPEFRFPDHEMSNNSSDGSCIPIPARGTIAMPGELEAQVPMGFPPFASGDNDSTRGFAAKTRALRRNRVARQRSQSVRQRQQGLARAASAGYGPWSSSPTLDLRTPVAKASHEVSLTFLLQKELRPSDVGNLGRIILPKKEAETHLPNLALREGMMLQLEDFDSEHSWKIRYRFWPNNKSRMYLLENTGEFVKLHRLQEGDFLILYRNQQGNYVMRGKKVHSENRGAQGIRQKNAHSLARGFPAASRSEDAVQERDFGEELLSADGFPAKSLERGLGSDLQAGSSEQGGVQERGLGLGLQAGSSEQAVVQERHLGLQLEDRSKLAKEGDLALVLGDWSYKSTGVGLLLEDQLCSKAIKTETSLLVGDEDRFFKEDVMHGIGATLGRPLERFPSLNLDFVMDDIEMIAKDDHENEGSKQAAALDP